MAILEIEGVNTFRGAAHVLNGISLNVGEEEVVCLVGRNGAGPDHPRDRVHDLHLVPGADPAGRLVEEQELWLQGIGERHVQ